MYSVTSPFVYELNTCFTGYSLSSQCCYSTDVYYITLTGSWSQGCSSDVPMPWYCFSTELRDDWKCPYAQSSTIAEYLKDVALNNGLYDKCRFQTQLISAEWSSSSSSWQLVVKDLESKESHRISAQILISAVGLFYDIRMPKVNGIELFKGEIFHSAKWKEGVDLRGKRIAVIGNGSSA